MGYTTRQANRGTVDTSTGGNGLIIEINSDTASWKLGVDTDSITPSDI